MKAKLGDLTKIRTGKLDANAASENGEYPFFTCSKEPLRISTYSYDCECVLVAGNGDLNTKYYNGKFDAYQRTYIIESNSDGRLHLPYLYYFMTRYIQDLRRLSIGGVIKYIKLGNLTDAEISLPDIEEQKVACKKLEKVKNIIDKKESQLFYLDSLIKARFVEMFDGEQCAILQDLSDRITDGSHLPPKGVEKSDYLMLSSQNVFDEINRDGARFLLKEDFENENRRTDIKDGDVLVTIVGIIGRTHIVRSGEKYVFQRSVGVIKPKSDRLNSVYLASYLQTCRAKAFLTSRAHGSSQKGIYLQDLKKLPVPLVPMALQNEFATFVAQVDKSKFALSNELAMGNFYIRLIHDCIMHGCIDL